MVPYTCNTTGGLNMPEYKGKHYPYTKKGKAQAKAARDKDKAKASKASPKKYA